MFRPRVATAQLAECTAGVKVLHLHLGNGKRENQRAADIRTWLIIGRMPAADSRFDRGAFLTLIFCMCSVLTYIFHKPILRVYGTTATCACFRNTTCRSSALYVVLTFGSTSEKLWAMREGRGLGGVGGVLGALEEGNTTSFYRFSKFSSAKRCDHCDCGRTFWPKNSLSFIKTKK